MASVDPDLYKKKVRYLLEGEYKNGPNPLSLSDLDLTFEDAPMPDVFPNKKRKLSLDGASTAVTEDNKEFYLQTLCDHRLYDAVRLQLKAFLRGFHAIIPEMVRNQMQRLITPTELELLLCGTSELDIEDWKKNSMQWEGLATKTWDLFWKVVASMDQRQRAELLEFVTGSPTLPAGGFAALPGYGGVGSVHRFTIAPRHSTAGAADHYGLPTAATCFNRLFLPPYPSEEVLRTALLEAVAHRGQGFHEAAVAH
jgi:E3 ubiquitin-protein ligase HUWE1